MFRPRLLRTSPPLVLVLLVACGSTTPTTSTPGPIGSPIAPREDGPSDSPQVSIPAGFVFPVPSPLTAGNAELYAQRALFERTGSLCFRQYEVDGEPGGDFDAMASKLATTEGILEDGRSFVGPIDHALRALDLESVGIVVGTVAYGIGTVTPQRAMPQLPVGAVWAPRLGRFLLDDGRIGWTLTGPWIAVVDDCGVLPTTPG